MIKGKKKRQNTIAYNVNILVVFLDNLMFLTWSVVLCDNIKKN